MADWRDGGGKKPKKPDQAKPRATGSGRPTTPPKAKKEDAAKPRPGWNQGEAGASAAGGTGWQRSPGRKKPLPRSVVVTGWVTAFVLLVAALIVYLLSQHTRVPVISLAVTSYTFNERNTPAIPANDWAQTDVDRIGTANDENLQHFNAADDSFIDEARLFKVLRDSLNSPLKDGGPVGGGGGPSRGLLSHSRNLVLFLSVHAAVAKRQGQLEPCLLLSDADPYHSETWLPLRKLFTNLEAWRKEDGFQNTHVVLILDCGRMATNPRMGVFESEVPGRLEALLVELQLKNLTVVTSHSNKQRSWGAPELRGSVFGHAVSLALNGAADRKPYGNNDDFVSMTEFAGYLATTVNRWVVTYRGVQQNPRVITTDTVGNFNLLSCAGAKPLAAIPTVAVNTEQTKRLSKLWLQLDKRLSQGGRQLDALGVARLERMLTHLEHLLFAGNEYAGEFDAVAGRAEAIANARLSYDLLPHSSFQFDSLFHSRPTAADRLVVEAQKHIESFNPETPPEKLTSDMYVRSVAAWDWLKNKPGGCRQQDLLQALKFAPAVQNSRFENVESQFISMLAGLPDHANPSTSGELPMDIQTAIRVRDYSEQLAAVRDMRIQYWLRPALNAADELRRTAEDLLYVGDATSLGKARQLYQQLMSPESSTGYRVAARIGEQVRLALAARDRAFSQVPHLLSRDFQIDATQVDSVLESVIDLSRHLQVTNLPENMSELLQKCSQLETLQKQTDERLDQLSATLRTISREMQNEVNEVSGNNSGLIMAILENPIVLKRRDAMRENLIRFFNSGKNRFEISESDVKTSDRPEIESYALHLTYLRQLTDFLLPADAKGASMDPDASFADQGESFRIRINHVSEVSRGLTGSAASDYKNLRAENGDASRTSLVNAERLMRSIVAFRPDSIGTSDPGQQRSNLDLCNLCLWQADRFLDDYWGPDPLAKSQVTPWFVEAADSCLRKANDIFPQTSGYLAGRQLQSVLQQRQQTRKDRSIEAVTDGLVEIPASASSAGVPVDLRLQVPDGNRPDGIAVFYFERRDDGKTATLIPDDGSAPVRRIPFSVGRLLNPSESKSRHVVLARADNGVPSKVDLKTVYRGHFISRIVDIREVKDEFTEQVTHQPPYQDAIITVERPDIRPIVNIVFDCSGSMDQKVAPGKSRGDVCRATLLSLLGKLDGRAEIGLMLYGHRLRYAYSQGRGSDIIVKKSGINSTNPSPLNPDWDVEQAIEIDSLTDAHRRDIVDKLADIKFQNGGQTPLFHAIVEALHKLESEGKLGGKQPLHLIVMTDGVNRLSDQSATRPKDDVNRIRAVLNSIRRNYEIQFDMIAVDVENIDDEDRSEWEELKKLTTKTRDIRTADEKDELFNAFEKAMRLYPFRVVERGNGDRELFQGRVGSSVRVECRSPKVVDVILSAFDRGESTKTLYLEGNEKIDLLVDDTADRSRLVLPHYDVNSISDAVTNEALQAVAGDAITYRVTAHAPSRDGEFIRFPISIQDAADSPNSLRRPQSVHAEIVPIVNGQPVAEQMSVHYDRLFTPVCPVGVIPWQKRAWTQDAGLAEIHLWFRPGQATPDHSERVTAEGKPLQPDALRGLGFFSISAKQANGKYVVEVLNQDNDKPNAVRVELNEQADSITRRFYTVPKNQTLHRFVFNGIPNLARLQVIFTRTETFKTGALAPRKPITLRFPAG